jgi:hypothetical protein
MRPEDVPQWWVDRARATYDRYNNSLRLALAAVIPDIRAAAYEDAARIAEAHASRVHLDTKVRAIAAAIREKGKRYE